MGTIIGSAVPPPLIDRYGSRPAPDRPPPLLLERGSRQTSVYIPARPNPLIYPTHS